MVINQFITYIDCHVDEFWSNLIIIIINILLLCSAAGYEDFSRRYPDYITVCAQSEDNQVTLGLSSLNLVEPSSPKSGEITPSPAFPIEVIKNLYLGNAKCSMDSEALLQNNIRYILNVTPNLPNHFEGSCDVDIKYKQIPIQDHWSQNLSAYFPEAIAFIGKAIPLTICLVSSWLTVKCLQSL